GKEHRFRAVTLFRKPTSWSPSAASPLSQRAHPAPHGLAASTQEGLLPGGAMLDRLLSSRGRRTLRPSYRPTLELLEDRSLPSTMPFAPLVGGVPDTTANVWARTDVPASVSVEYSTDAALTSSTVSGVVQTSSTHDFTAIVPIAGLQPLTRYYYRILVNGVPQETGNYPTFVTFPPVAAGT